MGLTLWLYLRGAVSDLGLLVLFGFLLMNYKSGTVRDTPRCLFRLLRGPVLNLLCCRKMCTTVALAGRPC